MLFKMTSHLVLIYTVHMIILLYYCKWHTFEIVNMKHLQDQTGYSISIFYLFYVFYRILLVQWQSYVHPHYILYMIH